MLDPNEERVAFNTLRRMIDGTGYGYFVSDPVCHQAATAVVQAVEQYRAGLAKPAAIMEVPDGDDAGLPEDPRQRN